MTGSLLRALATPQVLVSALLLAGALAYLLTGLRSAPAPVFIPETVAADPPARSLQEVRLVEIDGDGLERPRFVSLSLPAAPAERLEGILAALREGMVEGGAWPVALGAPRVFQQRIDRRLVAVLDFDFDVGSDLGLDVESEANLYRSISETLLSNGPERVVVLRGGEPADTFLGHLAVPGSP